MAATWRSGAKWGSSLTWRGSAAAYRNSTAYRTSTLDYRGGTLGGSTVNGTATAAASSSATATAALIAAASSTAAGSSSALVALSAPSTSAATSSSTAAATVIVPGTATAVAASAASGTGLHVYVTANDGSGLTQVAGTWSNPTNGYDDDPLTYTTLAAGSTGTYVLDITGYDFASVLGTDDELVEVSVNVSQYVSNAANFAAPTIQAFNGSTPLGSAITLTERTSAGNEDEDITALVTIGDLRSPDFKIRYSIEQVGV